MPTFKTKLKHKADTVIEVFGEFFTFTAGIGLLTTDTPAVIERLRAIPEGFIELDDEAGEDQRASLPPAPPEPPAPVPAPAEEPQTSASAGTTDPRPFVLKNGAGEELDLALLNDDQLRTFVVDNGLKVNGKAKGDTLRKAIHAALQPAA